MIARIYMVQASEGTPIHELRTRVCALAPSCAEALVVPGISALAIAANPIAPEPFAVVFFVEVVVERSTVPSPVSASIDLKLGFVMSHKSGNG